VEFEIGVLELVVLEVGRRPSEREDGNTSIGFRGTPTYRKGGTTPGRGRLACDGWFCSREAAEGDVCRPAADVGMFGLMIEQIKRW